MSLYKSTPLLKDEVLLLIQLVESESVVTSKHTDSASNRLKEEAWQRITNTFNESVFSCPRTTSQLRLKWENLKKTARKRKQKSPDGMVSEANEKRGSRQVTGGVNYEYVPPDEALDRVASIIGANCSGYTAEFGEDSEPLEGEVLPSKTEVPCSEQGSVCEDGCNDDASGSGNKNCIKTPRKFFFKRLSANADILRKREYEVHKSRIHRDNAMAEYYKTKMKKIELEIKLLKKKLNDD